MEKKLSKNDAFDIRKAPEELTEEDLDMVTGGEGSILLGGDDCPAYFMPY